MWCLGSARYCEVSQGCILPSKTKAEVWACWVPNSGSSLFGKNFKALVALALCGRVSLGESGQELLSPSADCFLGQPVPAPGFQSFQHLFAVLCVHLSKCCWMKSGMQIREINN